ncbi:sigma-70 family RNA polymerase sigma factor [Halobacillus litoralis]|uniref:RNA polymerase factor sigma C n=1 Tax=Halobacillus litoralis TaxID=45668 RepID=A0A410M9V1_9BACI|nr:sigma-70 family RNA polymerase sigma factor [Halobacillus litoralis]QAS51512.1 RNA polymerase factor sigma C [Halobacillus litoralis]
MKEKAEEDIKDLTNEGKQSFLNELMESHSKKVYLLAYSYVKDQGTAEDIAQDVFIKCFRYMDRFRGEAAISSWLYRITVNRSKDVLRRNKLAKLKYPLNYFDKEHQSESTEQTYIKQNQRERVLQAVMTLPIKYREVLVLFYFYDQKIEDISMTLEEKENTIKTRLARGREKLKTHPMIQERMI